MSLGAIVTAHPEAGPLFERIGLDFCCGGNQSLEAACVSKGYDPDEVLSLLNVDDVADTDPNDASLSGLSGPASNPGRHLEKWPLSKLIEHIESTHHAYLWEELERITGLTSKVARAHGMQDARLIELHEVMMNFAEEMAAHMQKEEQILFPMIRSLAAGAANAASHCGSVGNPIRQMRHEHESAGAALARMRELTADYAIPGHACMTYKAMLAALQRLESDTHAHVHKENNILFLRAMEL